MSKVLVIGPSWLGDMIMSQSLFKILHAQGKTIDVLAPKWNHAVLSCMPEVSNAIELPFDHGDLKLLERYKFAKKIKQNKYDECIVIPNSFKSALIAYWAKIKKRTGWLGEQRYFLLNNYRKLDKKNMPLMVQRLMALAYFDQNISLEEIASLNYPYPQLKIDNQFILNTLSKFNLSNNKNTIILAPGAAYGETKQWPADYFAKIANNKIKQGWQVWLLGSQNDKSITDVVNSKTNNQCNNLAGQLQLEETVALISKANLIISNDSGLLHVAAAVNTPLVGVYGSTSPDFTPPLIDENKKVILKPENLSCSPCFKKTCQFGHLKCLYDIKPEMVEHAIDKLVQVECEY